MAASVAPPGAEGSGRGCDEGAGVGQRKGDGREFNNTGGMRWLALLIGKYGQAIDHPLGGVLMKRGHRRGKRRPRQTDGRTDGRAGRGEVGRGRWYG